MYYHNINANGLRWLANTPPQLRYRLNLDHYKTLYLELDDKNVHHGTLSHGAMLSPEGLKTFILPPKDSFPHISTLVEFRIWTLCLDLVQTPALQFRFFCSFSINDTVFELCDT